MAALKAGQLPILKSLVSSDAVQSSPVCPAQALSGLFDRAAEIVRREEPDSGVIFNAVNNRLMEHLAKAKHHAGF